MKDRWASFCYYASRVFCFFAAVFMLTETIRKAPTDSYMDTFLSVAFGLFFLMYSKVREILERL